MRRYRYDADKGEAVPVETDEERLEREKREKKEQAEAAWLKEQEQRAVNKGGYL